jgi:peptidoglycan biosynthesis protein MviN/MurJ (putative lipid II flippase)
MSGTVGLNPEGKEAIRRRLDAGLRQIAFFVVPSAVAFLALGDVVAAGILVTGNFTYSDAVYVWGSSPALPWVAGVNAWPSLFFDRTTPSGTREHRCAMPSCVWF